MKGLQSTFMLSYRPDIDGLRAIAVLAVVAFHAFPSFMKGGFIGVDIFFVISGYLISSIIFINLENNSFSIIEFYIRRIKRIFPVLILVLVTCYIFGWFALFADEYKQLVKHMFAGSVFVSNFIFWNEDGYFDNVAETKPLLHLWSLSVEEQFYVIWPLLLCIIWNKKYNIPLFIMFTCTVSFCLNILVVNQNTVAAFYSPLTRFWELIVGSLLAWLDLYKQKEAYTILSKVTNWISGSLYSYGKIIDKSILSTMVSLIGLMFLVIGFFCINKRFSFPGIWALFPVIGTVLIISAGPQAWFNRIFLSNKIAIWFGLISFPLYLWHWPLLSLARIVESETLSGCMRFVLIVVSVLFAWLSYKLIEKPIRTNTNKNYCLYLVFFMMMIGIVAYSTYLSEGLVFRSTIKGYVNNKNELIRLPAKDEDCLKFLNKKETIFSYCRATNVNGDITIALIGDSHAHVAYPSAAEYLKQVHINTLLLANSGCPPMLGVPVGNNETQKHICDTGTRELLNTILSREDIKSVFFFARGPIYLTGTEPVDIQNPTAKRGIVSLEDFRFGMQQTIDLLTSHGKQVFYVTENPELSETAESCILRPLRIESKDCRVPKQSVIDRQKDYMSTLELLTNVNIINSLDVFCPTDRCVVFDEFGKLLYADDDHLSTAGGRFQLKHLLRASLMNYAESME